MTTYQLSSDWPCEERCPEPTFWPEPVVCGAPATNSYAWEDDCTRLTCTRGHQGSVDTAEILTRHDTPVDTDSDKTARVLALLDAPALGWTSAQQAALAHPLATPDGRG